MADIDPNVTAPVVPIQQPAVAPAPAAQPAQPQAPATQHQAFNPGTGDAVIDATVANFSRAFGVSADLYNSSIKAAVDSGDPNRIDVQAILRTAGAEAALEASRLVQALSGHVKTKDAQTITQIHAAAGGEVNWKNAVQHFNSTAPDFVKEQFQALLSSGDPAKVDYATRELVGRAVQAGVLAPNLAVTPGSGAPAGQVALSAQEFLEKRQDLYKRAGNRSLERGPFAVELQTLMQQRELGMKAGR